MTKLEAVKHLLRRDIRTRTVGYDYDPAGSSYEYEPDAQDCEALAALIPGFDRDKELWFQCGTSRSGDAYFLGPGAEGDIRMKPKPTPAWEQIEADVVRKLRYLRIAWEHTAKTPELHEPIRRDLYLPALLHLAAFCSAIEEKSDE